MTGVRNTEKARIRLSGKTVCLKIVADFNPGCDNATFYYSEDDGATWNRIGDEFKMRFDYRRFFMGTRFAIYNYATASGGGYVDVDYFRYRKL